MPFFLPTHPPSSDKSLTAQVINSGSRTNAKGLPLMGYGLGSVLRCAISSRSRRWARLSGNMFPSCVVFNPAMKFSPATQICFTGGRFPTCLICHLPRYTLPSTVASTMPSATTTSARRVILLLLPVWCRCLIAARATSLRPTCLGAAFGWERRHRHPERLLGYSPLSLVHRG